MNIFDHFMSGTRRFFKGRILLKIGQKSFWEYFRMCYSPQKSEKNLAHFPDEKSSFERNNIQDLAILAIFTEFIVWKQ